MSRKSFRSPLYRLLAVTCLVGVLVTHVGCAKLLFTIIRVVQGDPKVQPLYDGLKTKRVAIVCNTASPSYGPDSPAELIAREMGKLLKKRVDEIKLVSQDKVDDWQDRWDSLDYRDIARGVKAERLIAVDIKRFQIYDRTFFKGKAVVDLRVLDMENPDENWTLTAIEFDYPANGPVHSTETSESTFHKTFVKALARHLAKSFYAYEVREDFVSDPTVVR